MATYLVTLALETDPGQGDPAGWDWPALLDTPYAVDVVAIVEGPDAPAARGWMLNRLASHLTRAADYFNRTEA